MVCFSPTLGVTTGITMAPIGVPIIESDFPSPVEGPNDYYVDDLKLQPLAADDAKTTILQSSP